jgi:DHA1 family multidrug resistance protein-like MFS transporter
VFSHSTQLSKDKMTGIRDIIRDAPAGQLARLYLGFKISPYTDEKEGFQVSQQRSSEEESPETDPTDLEKEDGSEKEDASEKDVENLAADAPARAQPKSDPNAVEFTGPSDLDNPQNWSTLKKTFVFSQICLLTFASQYATISVAYKCLL